MNLTKSTSRSLGHERADMAFQKIKRRLCSPPVITFPDFSRLFTLTTAGQIFSCCIAEALATVESRDNILSYIDGNLVHAKTLDEYILALEQRFLPLRKFGLKLNPDKCTFFTSEAKFLGRIVNSKRFKADPEYVRAIRAMKPPTSKKEL